MSIRNSPSGVPYLAHDRAPSAQKGPGVTVRALLFLVIFALLQGLYGAAHGTRIERLVIDHATVGTAAWLIGAIDPTVGVVADGSKLLATGGGLNVLNGCEGTDAMFLLCSAMLVAPLGWRRRAMGLALGVALVFALNQARILALFYAYRSDKAVFDMLHGVVAPLAVVLGTAAFFVLWSGHGTASSPAART